MAESSDPLLLSKPASKLVKGGGSEGVHGTFSIYQSKVKWKPLDSSAAKIVIIDIASITSKRHSLLHTCSIPSPCRPAAPPAQSSSRPPASRFFGSSALQSPWAFHSSLKPTRMRSSSL